MAEDTDVVFEFDTDRGHYQVVDMIYDGRPARVLFSGEQQAAQSGLARDSKSELLFDYNQRMFELASGLQPPRVLLIGGGMFTLPMALLKAVPTMQIDAVELDDGLVAVASRYFGLIEDPRLRIIQSDGLAYLERNTNQYDMILLDAYTHTEAEASLTSSAAIALLHRSLTPQGVVAGNVIAAYYGRRSEALRRLVGVFETRFEAVSVYPASQSLSLWLPQNLLVVAQMQAATPMGDYLRYPSLNYEGQPFDLMRDLPPPQ